MPSLPIDLQTLLDVYGLGLSVQGALALGLLILAAVALGLALLRFPESKAINLRRLPAYDRIKQAVTDAAETGQTLHFSAGTGTIGSAATADTLAGVNAVGALAERAAAAGVSTVVTTSSALVLPVLQNKTEDAYQRAGAAREYDPSQVRFAGEDPFAYAVSVADIFGRDVGASFVLGSLGDEILLIGERGRMAGVPQVIGTVNSPALPYAVFTANHVAAGEEIYAAGAYLSGRRALVASLVAQDWLRLLVVAAIIVGVVIKTAGL